MSYIRALCCTFTVGRSLYSLSMQLSPGRLTNEPKIRAQQIYNSSFVGLTVSNASQVFILFFLLWSSKRLIGYRQCDQTSANHEAGTTHWLRGRHVVVLQQETRTRLCGRVCCPLGAPSSLSFGCLYRCHIYLELKLLKNKIKTSNNRGSAVCTSWRYENPESCWRYSQQNNHNSNDN